MELEKTRSFSQIFKTGPCEGLDKLSDVTLRTADGYAFNVHKVFLSQKSDYFKALFCSEIGVNCNTDVFISDINGQSMELIICYIYTGDIKLDATNVIDVLVAADFYLMEDLLKICETSAISYLNISNCLSLLVASLKVMKTNIQHFCYRFIQIHFGEIALTFLSDIAHISFESLHFILRSKSLNVETEMTVWAAIVEWSALCPLDRYRFVPELIACISIEDIDEDLACKIINHTIVQENTFCNELRNDGSTPVEALRSHSLKNFYINVRVPNELHIVACIYEAGSEVYATYDSHCDFWKHIARIELQPHAIFCILNLIYFIDTVLDSCLVLDPVSDTFLPTRHPFVHRTGYIILNLNDCLYALGGFTDSEWGSYEVDCYDTISEIWSPACPFLPMTISAAEVVDTRIIAIGDDFTENGISTMIAQMYYTEADQWSLISPPNRFRHDFAISVFRNQLFIFGGQDFDSYLQDAEIYDYFCDEWRYVLPLPIPFVSPRAYVFKDKLIVTESKYSALPSSASWDGCTGWNIIPHSKRFHEYVFCTIQNHQLVKEITYSNRRSRKRWIRSFFTI